MPSWYSEQFWFVKLGAGLASMAFFVEPQYLIDERNDQPTVEQKHLIKIRRLRVQWNMPIGQSEARHVVTTCMLVAVDLIASGQVEYAHGPLAPRLQHRQQMMLVGQYPCDRVLFGHTQTERFAQRV